MIAHRVETLSEAEEVYKITKGEAEKLDESEIVTVMKSIEDSEQKLEEFEEEKMIEL